MKNEVKLTDRDFQNIKDIAHRSFLEGSLSVTGKGGNNFLTKCFTEAIKSYTKRNGWIMKDGKIWEK